MNAKEEFIAKVEFIYSVYRDCWLAFGLALNNFTQQQEIMLKQYLSQGQSCTIGDLDKKKYHYAIKKPGSGEIDSVANLTQGQWKEKLGKDGSNIRQIGNFCLVMIYQFWEDKYREEIALSKGICKNDLNSNLFGEIRNLRRSIIHNNGRAINDVDKCKILKWFRAEDQIFIDSEKMDILIVLIKNEINAL